MLGRIGNRAEVRYLPQSLITDVPRMVAGLRVGQSFSAIPVSGPPVIRKGANGSRRSVEVDPKEKLPLRHGPRPFKVGAGTVCYAEQFGGLIGVQCNGQLVRWHVTDANPEPPSPEDVPQPTHPSPKAVELFQRALEIQAAEATGKWEPEGRRLRLEYIDIDIALMRELGRGFWGVSVLDVDENAEGPPAWERNPRNIASWHDAIRLRRALRATKPKARKLE